MVKQGEPERQFYFGAVVHGDYLELALLMPELEDRLNEQIDLRTFTDKLEHIYFAPLLVPELDAELPEERHYDEEQKELLLMLKIAVDHLKDDNPEQNFTASIGELLKKELACFEPENVVLGEKIFEVLSDLSFSE